MDIHAAIISSVELFARMFSLKRMSLDQRIRSEFGENLTDEEVGLVEDELMEYSADMQRVNRETMAKIHLPSILEDTLISQGFQEYFYKKYLRFDLRIV